MYYIICYKGKQLGKPMTQQEAVEKYEEMQHCLKSITLRKLSDLECEQLDLLSHKEAAKSMPPSYLN